MVPGTNEPLEYKSTLLLADEKPQTQQLESGSLLSMLQGFCSTDPFSILQY